MTDLVSSLPPMADPTLSGGGISALSMKMGPGGNIDKTAQDFEAMFATQMLQPMFEGINADPTFGGGNGEDIMRSFLLQEYGKIIAKGGKLGIATQVKAEMLRAQEGANGGKSGRALAASRGGKNPYAGALANASAKGGENVAVQ